MLFGDLWSSSTHWGEELQLWSTLEPYQKMNCLIQPVFMYFVFIFLKREFFSIIAARLKASLAQLVEQLTCNQ